MRYGPMNALADILGAYWKKERIEGAMDYAENYQKNLDDQTAQKYIQNPVQPEQYGAQAAKKAEQYLVATGKMPNPDWLGQNVQQPADAATRAFMNYVPQGVQAAQPANGSIMAAAQNAIQPTGQNFLQSPAQNAAQALQSNGQMPKLDWLGQGTASQQAAQAAPATAQPNHPQSIMQMMTDFAARNNPNNPTPAQQAALQKKNADFAAAKAANPQWYEGNYYVGDDPAARQQAKISQAQQAQQKAAILSQGDNAENGRFSSGMEQYGFTGQKTAPLSYQEVAAKKNQYKARAMKELVSKYGIEAAKQVEPMIDDAIGSKLEEMADSEDNQNRQALGRYLMSNNVNTQQGMQKALWAAEEYNHAAKQMGKPTIDTAMLGKILDSGKVSITAKDAGDRIDFFAVPKDGGTFGNDKNGNPIYMKPILADTKGMSLKDKSNIEISKAKLAEQHRYNMGGGGGGSRGGSSGGKQETWKQHYGPAMSAITKSIEDGHSKSYIYTQFSDAGGTEEEWNQLWTRSVENYYHKVQGDDADDSRDYLDGDGNPES